MCDMRQHEAPFDDGPRTLAKDLPWPAGLDGSDALLGVERRSEQTVDLCRRQIGPGTAIERHVERVGRTLGLPEMIGHDAHRIMARLVRRARVLRSRILVGDGNGGQPHDGPHAGHLEDVRLVADGGERTGESGRRPEGGVQHAGHDDVATEHCGARTLGPRVQPLQRLADQREVPRILQRRRGVERQLRGVGRQHAVGQAFARRMDHEALFGAAIANAHLPAGRRRADQHVARGGAGSAQAAVQDGRRHRRALLLDRRLVPEGNLVGLATGDEADPDPLPIRIEILGEDLWQRRVGALPQLRLRQAERDLARRRDQDPVRDLAIGSRSSGLAA